MRIPTTTTTKGPGKFLKNFFFFYIVSDMLSDQNRNHATSTQGSHIVNRIDQFLKCVTTVNLNKSFIAVVIVFIADQMGELLQDQHESD